MNFTYENEFHLTVNFHVVEWTFHDNVLKFGSYSCLLKITIAQVTIVSHKHTI